MDLSISTLQATALDYRTFTIPKRGGGRRSIRAPNPELEHVQRVILHRLLDALPVHPAVHGFERRRSIVSNAAPHVGRAVVIRFDLADFFDSTRARRARRLFRVVGWDREAAELLCRLCTDRGSLPQGAPTSPRLANLVNVRLDARLTGLADRFGATYTRYADDLTFSFPLDERPATHHLIHAVDHICADEGYRLHHGRKLRVRRQHEQQRVTGLVVNERVRLPRETRRWLRAVEHHRAVGRPSSLSDDQLRGWHSMQAMVSRSADRAGAETVAETTSGRPTKVCPDCAETVLAAARICRFCRHEFWAARETDESERPGRRADPPEDRLSGPEGADAVFRNRPDTMIKTFAATSEALALERFQADAAVAAKFDYLPVSRIWDGVKLTVTYRLRPRPAPNHDPALRTSPPKAPDVDEANSP